jgi:monoamine oxidase
MNMLRRDCLGWMGAAAITPLIGCQPKTPNLSGGFVGLDPARGHQLLSAAPNGMAEQRRADVLVLGAGVAGLAAARALRDAGVENIAVLELEDRAGGNARGGQMKGLACPLGAHYLPVPGDAAPELQHWLEELGLRRREAGRWVYDERHLCHSPQDRLYVNGQWQDGLLPMQGVGPNTLAQYRRFSALVEKERQSGRYAMPTVRLPDHPDTRALQQRSMAHWLGEQGLTDPHLRWYLNYACRDDYGAGLERVSAWAGLHYFAGRNGFFAPGDGPGNAEPILTWPEGNDWLTQRLAKGLGDRLHTGQLVRRVQETRQGVTVDVIDLARSVTVQWQARSVVMALPAFVAARILEASPDALRQLAAQTVYAPWVVVNLHLSGELRDKAGAAPSWDNVVYGGGGLGYVDAGAAARSAVRDQPWEHWHALALQELSGAHPDLPGKVTEVAVSRFGHGMAIPTVGLTLPTAPHTSRMAFAHSDWAGYSVFEEAFTRGHLAGAYIAKNWRS